MPQNTKAIPEATKSRKHHGCLLGGIIVIGILLLLLLVFSLIVFRPQPQLAADTFFSQEVVGFARFHIEPKSPIWQNLAERFARQLARREKNRISSGRILSLYTLMFHPLHYLYIYQGEDKSPEFLVVINVKRLGGLISYAMKRSARGNSALTEVPPPGGLSARCFSLDREKRLEFIAVTPRAIIISNCERRLQRALWRLYSGKPSQGLSADARNLLPADRVDEVVNGFLAGVGAVKFFSEIITGWCSQKGELPNALCQALRDAAIRGVTFRGRVVGEDTLNLQLEIAYESPTDAARLSEFFQQNPPRGNLPGEIEIALSNSDETIFARILVPRIRERLEEQLGW